MNNQTKAIILEVLREINSIFEGCEVSNTAADDPSGCNTTYTLDTERFRDKLQKRIDYLEVETEGE